VTSYCPWHNLRPFTLLLAFEYFLCWLKNQGVDSLYCSVRLLVIYRCERDIRSDLLTEILEHGTVRILDIGDGYLLRDFVAIDDVLPEKYLVGGRGYIGY
jgi:hypothetical protein